MYVTISSWHLITAYREGKFHIESYMLALLLCVLQLWCATQNCQEMIRRRWTTTRWTQIWRGIWANVSEQLTVSDEAIDCVHEKNYTFIFFLSLICLLFIYIFHYLVFHSLSSLLPSLSHSQPFFLSFSLRRNKIIGFGLYLISVPLTLNSFFSPHLFRLSISALWPPLWLQGRDQSGSPGQSGGGGGGVNMNIAAHSGGTVNAPTFIGCNISGPLAINSGGTPTTIQGGDISFFNL